jgi:CBS domain containing-hemolysin-like protein
VFVLLLIKIVLIIILILLTAFFVAAEFAIVKIRRTRIESLAAEGNKNAKAVLHVLARLDGYLSACQLGITITALGLGWLGEPTVEVLITPLLETTNLPEGVTHIISFSIAFALITFLHVVLGELAPKTVAIQKAEKVSLFLVKPLILFFKLAYPFIWLLNGAAALFLRMFGINMHSDHENAHTEEELRLILSESAQSGEINKEEFQFVNNIFTFDNLVARNIMIPRTEMVCVFKEQTIEENINIMQNERYTRFPVAVGDKDHIEGLVNIKEVFQDAIGRELKPLSSYIRPVIKVIETIPVKELLVRMQKEQMHLAILVDEYGGTAGLVTVEDILEEIVGEIRDEFDFDEQLTIQQVSDNTYLTQGRASIVEINELFSIELPHINVDTIAGWLMTMNNELQEGMVILFEDLQFEVIKMEDQQIQQVKIVKNANEEGGD